MTVGRLIEILSKFDPSRPIALMVPAHAKHLPVEVVEVFEKVYLPDPEESLVGRDDLVVIRSI
jgi:hypothetical protein